MGLHHRSLIAEICTSICHEKKSCSSSDCVYFCLQNCSTNQPDYYNSPPPPSPPIYADEAHHHPSKPLKISTFLIITLTLLGSAFLVLFCYFIYARFFSRRRRSQHQTEETRDSFFDEEHGPEMDHPIWYIRTIGLQQSIISEITVCRYKKGEGLVEGTECSVCLSEFQEDENLRLLPKCNHAFHLLCIDTWLRSHTNCPLCRAPIVTNPERERTPSLEPNVVDDSSSMEITQMAILEISGENNGGMENTASEAEEEAAAEDGRRVCEGSEAEVEKVQARRTSVSLDSSSAAKISLAPVTSLSVESGDGNSKNVRRSKGSSSFRTRSLQSVGTSMKRSRSYNGKHLLSWNGRSQRKPSVPLRSF